MSERFGNYELLERVGIGGMAEVFRARAYGAEGFVKEVCIKRILPAFSEDPDFVRMFINEARLAALLQHTNIVQILGFDQVSGSYFIAMEWVDGADLRKVHLTAQKRGLPVPRQFAVHVAIEALKGLHYAHTRMDTGKPLKLIHRDISPHNLLVSFSGEVKLTDFGIAKAAAVASATRTGMVKGKLAYMAPEQVAGGSIDQRTDLFSLAVVIWELLAGQRLRRGAEDEGHLFGMVQRGESTPLRDVNPEISPELAAVVHKMMAANVAERYGSAAEALREFSRFSGAHDTMDSAEYLRRLLPAGGEALKKGDTKSVEEISRPRPQTLSPDASTRTQYQGEAPAKKVEKTPRRKREVSSTGLLYRGTPATGSDDGALTGASVSPTAPNPLAVTELKQAHRTTTGTTARLVKRQLTRQRAAALLVAASAGALAITIWWLAPRGETSDGKSSTFESTPAVVAVATNTPKPVSAEPEQSANENVATPTVTATASTEIPVVASTTEVAVAVPPVAVVEKQPEAKPEPKLEPAPTTRAAAIPDVKQHDVKHDVKQDVPTEARVAKPDVKPDVKPEVKPAPKPEHKPEPQALGAIDIVVYPWATVRIDGRGKSLQTPIRGLQLAPGRHVIELRNRAIQRRERFTIQIVPGETFSVRRDWQLPIGTMTPSPTPATPTTNPPTPPR